MDQPSTLKDFSLSEYGALRKELSDTVLESRAVERYAVAATAAIWTWLLIQAPEKPWVGLIKWIPFAFCLLASIRSGALLLSIIRIADYIQLVEQEWGTANAFFWERYIKPKRWYLAVTAVVIWSVLLLGNLYLALNIGPCWFGAAKV